MPASLERKIIQERSGAELPGVRQEVAELIPAGELQGGIAIQRMVAADFKIMRTLRPHGVVRHIVRLRPGSERVQFRKRNRFQVRRREHSAIKRVEHVRLIILIRSAQSRTDLALVPQILYGIAAQAEVERPFVIGAPLILNPKLLPIKFAVKNFYFLSQKDFV